MRTLIVAAALVFTSAVAFNTGVGAQGKEHSMAGCLEKGSDEGTFRLTNLEKGPKTVEIAKTTANLTPHLGHKVEITGTAVTGKDPKAHTMEVTAVKMISATCP